MDAVGADQFLIDEIRNGSESAWKQLIDRFHGRLLAFARSRMASYADAEDLVQDTFIGFLQSLPHYDSSRSLETYLFTILRYKICDVLRAKSSASNVISTGHQDWWDDALPSPAETPSGIARRQEADRIQAKLLADTLRRLIHDFRDEGKFEDLQVIELSFYGGRRNKDIGELLDIDQKAVAGIKFRAIQKLQKLLSEADPSALSALDDATADVVVANVWRENRITCLKRKTLGASLLSMLDEPWKSYTQFHLDVVGCPMCLANLQDLTDEDETSTKMPSRESIFATSVGFLSQAPSESES